MKRVIKSNTSVEPNFLGIHAVGNRFSIQYRLDDDLSNLDAIIVDGANRIFGELSSGAYYYILCETPWGREAGPVSQMSPTVYSYKQKNGNWYIAFSAEGISGMRSAIASAHLKVTGNRKPDSNKFKYNDVDTAKQVFIESARIYSKNFE